ncbi:MAG: dephospho-CoA kinase [Planctomycetota bacterium]
MRPASNSPSESHPWVVGITGGIGSGKSTVAAAFARLGARVVDADRYAHEVMGDGNVIAQIAALLGAEVVAADGCLDRARIADLVFAAPELRQQLEGIVHPLVRTKIDKELAKWQAKGSDGGSPLPGSRPLIILDIPLLERSPYLQQVSAVVFVDAPLSDRIERVRRTRGWSEDELERREAAQVSVAEKQRGADHTVSNPGAATRGPATGIVAEADAVSELDVRCRELIDLWAVQLRS